MLKISPILSHIRKPIYTGHNTTCPLKPLQKDVFTRSGEISFSSLQAPKPKKINGKRVVFETTIQKNGKPTDAYVTLEQNKNGRTLTLYVSDKGEFKMCGNLVCNISKVRFYSQHEKEQTLYIKSLRNDVKNPKGGLYLQKVAEGNYKGVGTALLRAALKMSKGGKTASRLTLIAKNVDKAWGGVHPAPFYHQNGFRCYNKDEESALKACVDKHEEFKGDSLEMYLPEEHIEALERYNEADRDFLRHNDTYT